MSSGYSSLITRFQRRASEAPQAAAVDDGRTKLSYRELDAATDALAQKIRPHLRECPRVAVELPRSTEAIVAFLAIWKAGGSYVPLDVGLPPLRRAELISASRPAVVLGLKGEGGNPPSEIYIEVDLAGLRRGVEPAPEPASRSLLSEAYVLFTSGSTGRPKGVAIPDQAIVRLVIEPDYIRIVPDDVVLHFAPHSFDAATFEIWGALLNGASLAVFTESRPSPSLFRRFLRDRCCTIAWLTSGLFNALVDADPMILQPLRHVLTGGEALSPRHVARARRALPGLAVTNGYGPTENTTFTCCYTIPVDADVAEWNSIPIGRPILGTTVIIVDEHDRPVPAGTPGELLIGGIGLALGYLGDDALNAVKFVELASPDSGRHYRSGDLVVQRANGLIEFIGRVDDQVKINGFRIEPGEIAHHLKAHPAIEDAVVVAQPSSGGRRLVAYMKVAGSPSPREAELVEWLGERLPPQLVPARLIDLPAIPLNPRGKVDRGALPNPFVRESRAGDGSVEATPADLSSLLEAVSAALNHTKAEPDLSFQAQGGDSLSAMVVIDWWERASGRLLTVGQLLDARPLRAVATAGCGTANVRRPARLAVETGDPDSGPLSLAQEQIWFSVSSRPTTLAYNVTCRLDFERPVDRVGLLAGLDDVFRRHDLLHSVLVAGAPHQPIMWSRRSEWPLPLTRVDLGALDADAADQEMERQVAERARQPFELLGSPLIRWYWWDLPGRRIVVLQCEHHLIHDGWSLERVLSAWADAYRARRGSPAVGVTLEAASRSYFDFSRWQRRHVADEAGRGSLEFWRHKLSGLRHFSLPGETTQVADCELGVVLREEIPADLVRAFSDDARAAGCSPFEHGLAAFVALLLEESGEAEAAVGVGTANREQAEFRATIGMFVNMVTLRVARPEGPVSWGAWRNRVADGLREATQHQSVPFEEVVRAVNPERQAGRNPFFEVLFSMHQRVDRRGWFDGALCDYTEALDNRSAKFDLTVYLIEEPPPAAGLSPRFWVRWEYRASRFRPDTMQRRFRRYFELLRAELDSAAPWRCPASARVVALPVQAAATTALREEASPDQDRRTYFTMAIVSIWREHLPEAQIEADTNFFAVGGHSLLGMQIIFAIEEYLGAEIPLNSLFEAPTPARLAALLMPGAKLPALALSRLNQGSGRPLIMIHGWAGDAFGLFGLARELDSHVPVLALHVDPRRAPLADSLNKLAEHYAAYIDEKLDLPTYDLAGYSVGGVMAWAVALALQRRGKSIGAFLVIDTLPLQIPFPLNLLSHRLWFADRARERLTELRHAGWRQSLRLGRRIGDTVLRRTLRATRLPGLREVTLKVPSGAVGDAYQGLSSAWTPQRLPGDLDLLWSEDTNVDLPLAWSPWVGGKIRTHRVAGPHGELLKPPHAAAVARTIMEVLDRVRAPAVGGSHALRG